MKKFLYLSWFVITIFVIVFLNVADFKPNERPIVLLFGLLAIFGFPIYFLPSFVGAHRDVSMRFALFIANIAFGLTGVGWVILLIMALVLETDHDGPIQIAIVDDRTPDTHAAFPPTRDTRRLH